MTSPDDNDGGDVFPTRARSSVSALAPGPGQLSQASTSSLKSSSSSSLPSSSGHRKSQLGEMSEVRVARLLHADSFVGGYGSDGPSGSDDDDDDGPGNKG